MWLFSSTPPPPAAASDQETEWSVQWQSLPPLARLFSGQPRPFARGFATVEGVQMKEKEFILWEACTAEEHRPQSEQMLEVPMPLYPSSPFLIYYQVTSMETVHTAAAASQSRPGRERRGYGNVVYQDILNILWFPFLLPHSSMINTTAQELQEVMKTVGLGCIRERKKFSLQAHPKSRDQEGHDLHMLFCSLLLPFPVVLCTVW